MTARFSLNVLTVKQCGRSELECSFGVKTGKSKVIHGDVSENLITTLLENSRKEIWKDENKSE